jgi:uncharacterized protein YndB with AHSA1/START domain
MFTFAAQESIVIDRPIEEVYAFIAEPENDLKWCPAVKSIERISGNGPGSGAKYQMHHAPGGLKFDATVEVVACEPPRLFKWTMLDSGHTLHGRYELEAENGRTRLTQTSQITFEGWLRFPGLLMKRFIVKDVHQELRKQFDNLKHLLEGAK